MNATPTTEINWSDMTATGIDTDRVERYSNPLDTSLKMFEAISRDGSEKILFGEYWDREEGGWDLGVYENVGTADEPVWEMRGGPSYSETPAEILAEVRDWLAEN